MRGFATRTGSGAYGRRINRTHSPLVATVLPWLTIMLGSLLPVFFIAAALPLVPATGFVMLLAWRLVRPGLLPVWAGFPLGLFDDLFSGQPLGSAIVLWSLAMIAVELLDRRIPWRTFAQDWAVAALALLTYCLAAFLVSGASPGLPAAIALGPQILFSWLLFPAAARLVGVFDQLRLLRFRTIT